jgi:hypothetical protein
MAGQRSRDRGGEDVGWFTKRRKPSDVDALDAVHPVESLRLATAAGGVEVATLRLSLPVGEGDITLRRNRHEIWVSDGVGTARWRVEALTSLFRGERQPPPDVAMARYPPAYVPFFAGIAHSVLLCCTLTRHPTDAACLECYTQMRRRSDGRSLGPLHDVIWQSAAVALGLRPWSEAEYTAVLGQLARSARHFKTGPSSRNYMEYLQQTLGSR